MSRNSLTLRIPQPCQVSWRDLESGEDGRFCRVCNQCVVDFTGCSDTEILKYLQGAGTKVCGRFRTGQLNRPLEAPPLKQAWRTPLMLGMLLSGLLIRQPARGKTPAASAWTATPVRNPVAALSGKDRPTGPGKMITGTVKDSTSGMPLSGAVIWMKGAPLMTTTDANGRYHLQIPDTLADRPCMLEASCMGLKNVEKWLSVSDTSLNFELGYEKGGELSAQIGGLAIVRRRGIWQRIKSCFRH